MENYNLVRPEHLNHHGFLFGGQLLSWVDEYAWMAAAMDFPDCRFVTRAMDKIEFRHQVKNGSILKFLADKSGQGNTSISYLIKVYTNNNSEKPDKLVFSTSVTFVSVDESGRKKKISL